MVGSNVNSGSGTGTTQMGRTIESVSQEFDPVNSIWYSPGTLMDVTKSNAGSQLTWISGKRQQEIGLLMSKHSASSGPTNH